MAQNNTRRSFGTVLMGLGLVLILAVAGYLVWSEIESAQVRAELQQSAAAAALPAAEAAAAAPAVAEAAPPPTRVEPAQMAAVARIAETATRRPVQATATRPAATATRAPRATQVLPAKIIPTEPKAPVEPVRMNIPDLKIDAKVVPMGWEVVQTKTGPVSQWVIPKSAAGHHINSAGLGEQGNLVISGHNNIFGMVFKPISLAWDNDARVKVDAFTDKSDILTGRTIELFDAAGKKYTYRITEFYRLKDTGVSQQQRLANGKYILPTEDERVTLVTCWPPTNNTHRLIVIAQPAP